MRLCESFRSRVYRQSVVEVRIAVVGGDGRSKYPMKSSVRRKNAPAIRTRRAARATGKTDNDLTPRDRASLSARSRSGEAAPPLYPSDFQRFLRQETSARCILGVRASGASLPLRNACHISVSVPRQVVRAQVRLPRGGIALPTPLASYSYWFLPRVIALSMLSGRPFHASRSYELARRLISAIYRIAELQIFLCASR